MAGAIGDRKNGALGHEAVGVIHALGDQVRGFREGDRVAVEALGGWKFANVADGMVKPLILFG